ncbi:MAG: hypothetical protein ABEJ35_07865 [Halobacteriaceae archaeon]
MQRRDLLKTIGGIGVGTAAGVGALTLGGTGTSVAASFTIDGATLSNDDGDVTQIGLTAKHRGQWAIPSRGTTIHTGSAPLAT